MIATTDFFMPIVDDPFDYGRIAAANALADVYAMGGTPIMALALVGMPIKVLAKETIRDILRGGEAIASQVGIPIAGGHSIDSVEPIYGLVAIGVAHPKQIKRNCDARPGDAVVLGKPLGIGVLSAALKKDRLDDAGYRALVDTATCLNRAGSELGKLAAVHAMTDVTGFGLLGHLLEMCRGAGLGARLCMTDIPLLGGVRELAEAGCVTGASERNWQSYGDQVRLAAELSPVHKALLCDPQTSGGLLIACAPEAVDTVLATLARGGCAHAACIGEMIEAAPEVSVTA